MWMQSKTKMWHKVGFTTKNNYCDELGIKGEIVTLAKCQSYNLDRPNPLYGEAVENLPENAKVCKKCLGGKNK